MNAHAAPSAEAMPSAEGASPVMAQFFAAKARQPDALVFFRMGDFYELFFEDAVRAAEAIGITLTYRGQHQGRDIPMAGVPAHAAEAYLAKLIRAGFKVSVCEQVESPAAAKARGGKSIVRREVTRIVTPGTLTEEGLLDARGANRLAAVAVRGPRRRWPAWRSPPARSRSRPCRARAWPARSRRCARPRSWRPSACSPTRWRPRR